MSTPDMAGGPRFVADPAATCQLPVGSLLRDTDGKAYRLIGVHPPSPLLQDGQERPVLATLDLEGYAGTLWRAPYPLFVVWTPDADTTPAPKETTTHE